MTTLDAIYENGIFIPVSDAPLAFKNHEHVKLSVEIDNVERPQNGNLRKVASNQRSAVRIVEETFGSTPPMNRKDLISLAEDEEFSGY